ncbi:MAG: right-handed parallel beta-helix repeat-containing protein [Pirellulales bacterium]|nr:right-handed parallel beta-helix repeat-containing protein [Pirellulales bacterium]
MHHGKLAATLLLLAVATTTVLSPEARADADFFVSTIGNDQWSGTLAEPNSEGTDGPLATVDGARHAVRALKKGQPDRARPIVVSIRGGTYFLDRPITFGPEDSGTQQAPVVYQAYAGERPVLSGGVAIGDWKVDDDGRWSAELDRVKSGRWTFAQLFVNDQRRFRPRLPQTGYYHIAKEVPPSPKTGGNGHDRFGFSGDELNADWANLEDIEVMAFHQWSASRMRIASIDAEQGVVTFTGQTRSSGWWGKYIQGHRFLVVNVREAIGQPGQWYLDRPSGRLTYVPMPGETPRDTVAIAPRLEQLLIFAGDGQQQRWVEHVQLKGLTLAHTNWLLPADGQAFPQAEIGLASAVAAMGARHVVLHGCCVRHTGGYAIAFGPGCRHNRLEDCELFDLGAGGVKIGHAASGSWGDVQQVPQSEEAIVSHHTVRNCLIAHGGRLHPAAVGVWIGHSPYNVIEHNDIFDLYYTGLSVGWTWGYAPSHAHHNDVGFNHVHTIGQGVLSDMGGIYTLGVSPGTVVHDNHFHDVQSFDYGGWGLYTDEGSTGIVMKNNLVYRCKCGGFHQHYGKENRIENNILAFGTLHQIQRTRAEEHLSFFFERNIVYWDNDSPLLGSNWNDDNFRMDYNLYFHAGKPVAFPGGLTLDQWQERRKQDLHSKVADPQFKDPGKDDFRLKDDSPALGLDFQPFDATKAGRTTPCVLTKDLPAVPAAFE